MELKTNIQSRIGAACARQFAEKGVHLALTYASNLTAINNLTEELKAVSPALRISIHQVDVGSAEQIQDMFLQIDKEHGQRPDILVSNAGYGKRVPQIWDITLEEFDYTINVNLRASFILVKGVVEHMRNQRWGRIIFMSSIAGYGGGINGCRMSPITSTTHLNSEANPIPGRLRLIQGRHDRHDEESLHPSSRVQH